MDFLFTRRMLCDGCCVADVVWRMLCDGCCVTDVVSPFHKFIQPSCRVAELLRSPLNPFLNPRLPPTTTTTHDPPLSPEHTTCFLMPLEHTGDFDAADSSPLDVQNVIDAISTNPVDCIT